MMVEKTKEIMSQANSISHTKADDWQKEKVTGDIW